MTMCATACSTTGLSGVAMTPFVPHSSAFIGVCMYLGLYVEPQGFVSCFHFSFCFINARVLLSPPHPRVYSPRLPGVFHLDSILCIPSDCLHWFQMKPCCFLHSAALALASLSFPFSEFHPHKLTVFLFLMLLCLL